jgi:pimeloyl-ACP methyl ester carboxylesterase
MLPITLSQIADRLVLSPTRSTLFAYGKSRRLIASRGGEIEVWTERNGACEPDWFVLKFHGKCGRAERSNLHPFDHWPDMAGEVWSVNPPGYGGSSGKATLPALAPAADCVFEELLAVAAGRPIILSAHSLGTASALYLAARYGESANIAGMVLHNPPPMAELIVGKYGWRSLGLSGLIAYKFPRELDSIANARAVNIPAVFVTSEQDRMVPPRYQRMVIKAYGGRKQVVELAGVGHNVRFSPSQRLRYGRALAWLREKMEPAAERMLVSRVTAELAPTQAAAEFRDHFSRL